MTPSKENYLKVMLELSGETCVRSIDIANALGVSKASVSNMMNVLRDEGYVAKEKYGDVSLTEKGKAVAADIKSRYETLTCFLHHALGVDAETAAKDACRMEHIISCETADCMDRQLEKLSGSAENKKGANGESLVPRAGKKRPTDQTKELS